MLANGIARAVQGQPCDISVRKPFMQALSCPPARHGFVCFVLLTISVSIAHSAEETLHERIDRMLEQAGSGVAAPLVSDAEYLRRVSLDLIGIPPSVGEIRAFLADTSPTKRASVIDRLLGDPRSVRHVATVLDMMLMERRAHQHVSADEWHNYLVQAVRSNKPYNVLAREILSADGVDPQLRPAVRFYLDRGAEPNLLTRDVGRIFFGRDLQCAQCHDHPLIDDYLQADYHGLFAFLSPGFAFTLPDGDKKTFYAERAGSEVQFESVFIKGTRHITGPRLPGLAEMAEPVFLPGEEYTVPPADNVRPVPKHSRRAALAEWATNGSNRAFNENIVNRLWAHMFGRGLVHPVDLHHSGNPPSHPELLQALGEHFAASGFDVKAFLRELALTRAYQRSIDFPPNVVESSANAAAFVARLEQERAALATAAEQSQSAYEQAVDAWNAAESALLPVVAEVAQARTKYTETLNKLRQAEKAVVDATAQFTARQDIAKVVAAAAAKAQEAVQKLPQDQELAAAAQKFFERMNQLNGEVAALQKVVEEKTAAVQAPKAEWDAARPTLDAVQAKYQPLKQAVLQTEQIVVAARQKMIADATALNRHLANLEMAKQFAGLKSIHDQAATAAEANVKTAAAQSQAEQAALDAAIAELASRWSDQFVIGSLKPLTPEQMCWSIFQVTGILDRYTQAEQAELDKTKPLSDEAKKDPAQLAARAIELEQRVYDKLKGNLPAFISVYGAAAGQPQTDFFATADQALFAANGAAINSWIAPSGGNVTERIINEPDPRKAAEDLYLTLLTRMPTEEEITDVTNCFAARPNEKAAVAQQLVWGLLTSVEFRFNH